eukprot:6492016-Amphidinium_carterae.2
MPQCNSSTVRVSRASSSTDSGHFASKNATDATHPLHTTLEAEEEEQADQEQVGNEIRAVRFATFNTLSLGATDHKQGKSRGLNATAKTKWLEKCFVKEQLDVIGLQECRLASTGKFEDQHFTRFCEAAVKGHEGFQVWVATSLKATGVWSTMVGTRIQSLSLRIGDQLVLVLNVHAPTAENESAHPQFYADLTSAMKLRKNHAHVVILCDLNMRFLECQHFRCIGEYAISPSVHKDSTLVEGTAQLLDDHSMHVINTKLPANQYMTWYHPAQAKKAQIDYVIMSSALATRATSVRVYHPDDIEADLVSDHCLVSVVTSMVLNRRARTKRVLSNKIRSDDHLLAMKLQVAHSGVLPPREERNSADRVQQLFEWLASEREEAKPDNQRVQKQPWIRSTSWEVMNGLADLRKHMKKEFEFAIKTEVKRAFRRWARKKWDVASSDSIISGVGSLLLLTSCRMLATKVKIARLQKDSRKRLKADREQWLSSRCEDAQRAAEEDTRQFYGIIKQLTSWKPKALPGVEMANGRMATTEDEIRSTWSTHWKQVYCASELVAAEVDPFVLNLDAEPHQELDQNHDSCITLQDVLLAIKSAKARKASPDPIDITTIKGFAATLAPALLELYNDVLRTGKVPPAWKGAELVTIKKPAKKSAAPSSFRPVSLILQSQKLLEKIILRKWLAPLPMDDEQMAVRKGYGVDIAHLALMQMTQWTSEEGLSFSITFTDISFAFDKVVKQVLFGPCSGDVDKEVWALDLGEEQTFRLLQWLTFNRPLLENRHIPPEIFAFLKNMSHDNWMKMTIASGAIPLMMKLSTGVRQGGVASSLIYCLYAAAMKGEQKRLLEDAGLLQSIPMKTSLFDEDTSDSFSIVSLDFVDDTASPRWASTPSELIQASRHALEINLGVIRTFGLQPNLSKEKTEVCIRLRGEGAASLRLGLNRENCLTLSTGEKVNLTSVYKYLGRMVTAGGSVCQELKYRRQEATQAIF